MQSNDGVLSGIILAQTTDCLTSLSEVGMFQRLFISKPQSVAASLAAEFDVEIERVLVLIYGSIRFPSFRFPIVVFVTVEECKYPREGVF